MRHLFGNRGFVLLWFSQIFTQLGANTFSFVLALRIFEISRSNTAVGLAMLIYGLPAFLFGLVAGTLSDKFNKLRILFLVNLLLLLLSVLLFFLPGTLISFFVLIFSFSFVLQFFFPTMAAMLPVLVSGEQLFSAVSVYTMTFYVTVTLGYTLAGPLLRFMGPDKIFLFIGFYFLISAVMLKKIGFQTPSRVSRVIETLKILNPFLDTGVIVEVVGGFRQALALIKNNHRIKWALTLLVFSQLLITVLLSLSPGFAVTVLRIDVTQSSVYIILPAALGVLLGSFMLGVFGKDWGRDRLIIFGLFLASFCLFVLSFVQLRSGGLPFISIVPIFFFGFANTLLEVPSNAFLQEESGQQRGKIYGLFGSLVYGVSFLPLVLTGALADRVGVSLVIFFFAVLSLVVSMFALGRLRYLTDLPMKS